MNLKILLFSAINLILLLIFSNCIPRSFDIVLYDNQKYEKTNIEDLLIVKSRLEIPDKYFEIGVIKATKETPLSYIKDQAAKKGADIVINEGNYIFTLAKYKFSKKEKKDEKKSI